MTSYDHLISKHPGLIPQMRGFLTSQKYNGAVILVDHKTDLPFVYLIVSTGIDKTIAAKRAHERMAEQYGVKIMQYHGDNLRFDDDAFKHECITLGQTFSYSGVGAPHQNRRAESTVKQLSYES